MLPYIATTVVALLMAGHLVIAQDQCCHTIRVSTTGPANSSQSVRMGLYERVDTFFDRPVYLHQEIDEYLFYMGGRTRGLWMIGPEVGFFSGGLANRADTKCVENIRQSWKYADGTGWSKDPFVKAKCEKDALECFYADETQLVGDGNALNPKPINVGNTADCIESCINTWGCRYWTVSKSPNLATGSVECHLKSWKGRREQAQGFISGSLPSACYKSNDDSKEDQIKDEKNPCVYNNLEFKGGDLSVIPSLGFEACKSACQKFKGCSFFTVTSLACILKDSNVEIHRKSGVLSGATDQTCGEVIQHKEALDQKHEDQKYDENEVNGKFRITSEEWTDSLTDRNSIDYRELTTTLSTGLKEMLMEDEELSDKADFEVEIVKLTQGSVVCNFKIKYILKEAFVAIPFSIKPSNITVSLNRGFEFKKGILFQRFVIARGSFKASSPVDHCDAKGCSHKCAYDYELEDYRCTCPPKLYLSDDDRTCREALDGASTSTSTESSIVVNLLPTDCLWSEWSDWSPCTKTCGDSAFRSRTRKVIIPARNGGQCRGNELDKYDCPFKPCETSTKTTSTEAVITDEVTEFGTKFTTTTEKQSSAGEPRGLDVTTTIDTTTQTTLIPAEITTEAKEITTATDVITKEEESMTTLKPIPDEIETTTVEKGTTFTTTTLSPKAVLEDEEDDSILLTTEKPVEDKEPIKELIKMILSGDDCPDDQKAKIGDQLTIDYEGRLLENNVKFDSTLDTGVPLVLVLGSSEIIEGWTQGLVGTCPGQTISLEVPSHLAYGPEGLGIIPSNSDLVFEIDILSTQKDSILLTTEKAGKDDISEVIDVTTDGPPLEPRIEITTDPAIIEATTKYLEEAQELSTIRSIPMEEDVVTTTTLASIEDVKMTTIGPEVPTTILPTIIESPSTTRAQITELRRNVLSGDDCPDDRKAKVGDELTIDYEGRVASNDFKFDSTFDSETPLVFVLGETGIEGWTRGLAGICAGQSIKLEIPSPLAYGPEGAGVIPPDADLVFEITLISVKPTEEFTTTLSPEEELIVTTQSADAEEIIIDTTTIADVMDEVTTTTESIEIFVDKDPENLPMTTIEPEIYSTSEIITTIDDGAITMISTTTKSLIEGGQEPRELNITTIMVQPTTTKMPSTESTIEFGEDIEDTTTIAPELEDEEDIITTMEPLMEEPVMTVDTLETTVVPELLVEDDITTETSAIISSTTISTTKKPIKELLKMILSGDDCPEDQKAKIGDELTIDYEGRLLANDVKFDSSLDTGVPLVLVLGSTKIIEGWTQGLVGTCPGQTIGLEVPSHLAYGREGLGIIPPNSDLVFEIDIVSVQKPLTTTTISPVFTETTRVMSEKDEVESTTIMVTMSVHEEVSFSTKTLETTTPMPELEPRTSTRAPLTELSIRIISGGDCPNDERADLGDELTCHYEGRFANNDFKFDSSIDRDEPIVFMLGSSSVIDGWTQGLLGTCSGQTLELHVPSALGYGSESVGIIPPDTDLVFEIAVIAIIKPKVDVITTTTIEPDFEAATKVPLATTTLSTTIDEKDVKETTVATIIEDETTTITSTTTTKMHPQFTELKKKILSGDECFEDDKAMIGDELTIDYEGRLAMSGLKFDSSMDNGLPLVFVLGNTGIEGWTQGIVGTCPGQTIQLEVPFTLGYGSEGAGIIPPKSDLIFEITLLSVKPIDNIVATPSPDVTEITVASIIEEETTTLTSTSTTKTKPQFTELRKIILSGEDCLDEEKAMIGDELSIDYEGRLALNDLKFDSSLDSGIPLIFVLGNTGIEGWTQGIVGTCPGQTIQLEVPFALGYGVEGAGIIPPNSDLVFEIILLSVKPMEDIVTTLSPEEIITTTTVSDEATLKSETQEPREIDVGEITVPTTTTRTTDEDIVETITTPKISTKAPITTLNKKIVSGDECPEDQRAKVGDELTIHYEGRLAVNDVKFDSSFDTGSPLVFVLGNTGIEGWAQGITGTCSGQKILLEIPSSLGYGPEGQGVIPSDADLVFEITLISIEPSEEPATTITSIIDFITTSFKTTDEVKDITTLSPTATEETITTSTTTITTTTTTATTMTPFTELMKTILSGEDCEEDEKAQIGDELTLNYEGRLASSNVKFDSSYDRFEPIVIVLGSSSVIDGWTQGLTGLCPNQTIKLEVPSILGYGSEGVGVIPPDSDLLFEITLVSREPRDELTTTTSSEEVDEQESTTTKEPLLAPKLPDAFVDDEDTTSTSKPLVAPELPTAFVDEESTTIEPEIGTTIKISTIATTTRAPITKLTKKIISGEDCEEDKKANVGDELTVHYEGRLAVNDVKFDSSSDNGIPLVFILGNTGIEGWTQGITGTCPGQKISLEIPSSLGYGPEGQGIIPPNADLVFEITLISIETPDESTTQRLLPDKEPRIIDLETTMTPILAPELEPAFEEQETTIEPLLAPVLEPAFGDEERTQPPILAPELEPAFEDQETTVEPLLAPELEPAFGDEGTTQPPILAPELKPAFEDLETTVDPLLAPKLEPAFGETTQPPVLAPELKPAFEDQESTMGPLLAPELEPAFEDQEMTQLPILAPELKPVFDDDDDGKVTFKPFTTEIFEDGKDTTESTVLFETTTVKESTDRDRGISVKDIIVQTTTVQPSEEDLTTTEDDFMYPMMIEAETKKPLETTTLSILDSVVDLITTTFESIHSKEESSTFIPIIDDDVETTTVTGSLPTTRSPFTELVRNILSSDDCPDHQKAKVGDELTIDYEGRVASNDFKFDSTFDSGTPLVFVLGETGIEGWTQGLAGICAGQSIKLEIPSTLAYGPEGAGVIPPDADLVFEITLISVKPTEELTTTLSPEGELVDETTVKDSIATEKIFDITAKPVINPDDEATTKSEMAEPREIFVDIPTTTTGVTREEVETTTTEKSLPESTTMKQTIPIILPLSRDDEEKATIRIVEPETTTRAEIQEVDFSTTTLEPMVITDESSDSVTTTGTSSSTSPTSMDDEDEMLEVEEEPVEDIDDPAVHTLKCLPGVPEVHSGMIPMSCKVQEDQDPITVLISAEGLDLDTLVRKNLKIVVKDYMLMEMQQRPVSLKPRKRR